MGKAEESKKLEEQKKKEEEEKAAREKLNKRPKAQHQANPYYKTQMCPLFAKSQCTNAASGMDCFYAHSQEELRMTPEAQMHFHHQRMGMGMMMPNQMMGMMGPGMPPPGMPPQMMMQPGQMPMQMPGAAAPQ